MTITILTNYDIALTRHLKVKKDIQYKGSWPSFFIVHDKTFGGLHKDIANTAFWQYVIQGTKRWVILSQGSIDPPNFFEQEMYKVDVHAGELIFIPGGSPHQVKNEGLTMAVAGNVIFFSVITPALIIFLGVIFINVAQVKIPHKLPEFLTNWDFLPLWMHSLDPLDNLLRYICCGFSFCNKYAGVQKTNDDDCPATPPNSDFYEQ